MIFRILKLFHFIFILIFVVLCARISQKSFPHDPVHPSVNATDGSVQNGVITVKFKHEVKVAIGENGCVLFGISSLDQLSETYQVVKVKPAFIMRHTLADTAQSSLSHIYQIIFLKPVKASVVARAFVADSHVEYAEPVPLMKLDQKTPIKED